MKTITLETTVSIEPTHELLDVLRMDATKVDMDSEMDINVVAELNVFIDQPLKDERDGSYSEIKSISRAGIKFNEDILGEQIVEDIEVMGFEEALNENQNR